MPIISSYRSPEEGSIPKKYEFTQSTPVDTWYVTHGLNCKPHVMVCDDQNRLISLIDVTYTDLNSLVITFSDPIAGSASCV